jgi:hypothetical protein
MSTCTICETPLDPVWAEVGETKHQWCVENGTCSHGEIRGSRYCALCRYSNPLAARPPSAFPRRRKRALTPA